MWLLDWLINLSGFIILQLKLFAKFIDVSNIIEDDSTRVYAICDTELEYFYYNKHEKFRIEVFFFFFLMLFVPFIFITTSLVVTRSCKESISIVATKKSSHQNLVAVVLTGIFMTYFILACDIAAVAHAYQPSLDTFNETHNLSESFNYISTISLLVFDVFSSSIFIGLPMLYVCINNMTQDSIFDNDKCRHKCCDNDKCKKCYMDCYRTIYTWPMYILLGFTNQDEYWTKEKLDNYRLVWIVVSSLAAPLFCVGSHAGFILVAWLTDTSQASSIGLLSMAVLFYMFLMFRQCYKANDQIKPECWCQSCCLCFFPVGSCIKYVFSIFWCCCCCLKKDKRKGCEKCMFSKRERSGELMNLTSIKYTSYSGNADDSADDSDRNYEGMWWQCCQTCITSETTPTLQETPSPQQCQGLNSIALAIVYAWGWVLVSTVVVTLGGFVALPITTFDALSRILDTFEVFVLLFSLLITYKILSLGEPDINRFLQKIRRKYINNKRKGNTNREPNDIEAVEDKILDVEDKTLDDIEAVGSLVGELAEVVIHKLKKE